MSNRRELVGPVGATLAALALSSAVWALVSRDGISWHTVIIPWCAGWLCALAVVQWRDWYIARRRVPKPPELCPHGDGWDDCPVCRH